VVESGIVYGVRRLPVAFDPAPGGPRRPS